jgi:hypothetical protein
MNRLTNCLACFTLFAVSAAAQGISYADGSAGPTLLVDRSKDGRDVTVTCARAEFPGALILLGSFDGAMASLGKGLPSILANSSVLAMAFVPGESIQVSAKWPPVHVLLQAVEVGFKPFGVATSEVMEIGDKPIADTMVDAARRAKGDVYPPGYVHPANYVDAAGNLH